MKRVAIVHALPSAATSNDTRTHKVRQKYLLVIYIDATSSRSAKFDGVDSADDNSTEKVAWRFE